jgi:3-hydroxymyristoyl/3-hydroxydecanoyl-(acyl carrier protein) dehydratase
MGKEEISKLIDIYPPFLMIDGVREVSPGKTSSCYVNVTGEEWYLKAHIPSLCLMPGTLLIELMLQTAVLMLYTMEDFSGEKAIIQTIESKLIRNINPPTLIESFCEINSFRRGIAQIVGNVSSDGKLLCTGKFQYVCPHMMPLPLKSLNPEGS